MTTFVLFEWFLYACANLLPQLSLITITCKDFLRFSYKKTIIMSFLVLLWYWGCLVGSETGLLSYMIMNYVLNAGYVVFGILLTKNKPWQLLFSLAMVLNYGSVCAILSGGFFHSLDLEDFEFGWRDSLLTLCIAGCFWPLYYKLLVGRLRPLFMKEDADGIWKILWLVPTLFCMIHYFCIWTSRGMFSDHFSNVVFLVVVNLGSAVVSYLIAKLVDEKVRLVRLESENQRLLMQAAQYEKLKERMEETRQARHDLRQHLRLIQSYLDADNQTALQDYLREYAQTLPMDFGIRYCENIAIDTIVRYYAEQAQANNISFKSRMELPADIPLPEPDLCVLLGNLLENAIESCKKHPSDISRICVGSQLMGTQMLTIIVDNSPADKPDFKNEVLLSAKHSGAGIGTASVRSIAKRYNGEVRFEYQDTVFSASVVLMLPTH